MYWGARAPRGLPVLRALSRETSVPAVARAAVTALARYGDPAALPEILRHAGHPEAEVRRAVATALRALPPADHPEAVEHLRALAEDSDAEVRDRATRTSAGPGRGIREARETRETREAREARAAREARDV